jgi:predicted AAA+ superfamily ATPase
LGRELELVERGSWVVIDEVQKVPALLDEVHRLIEKRELKFVLCGSSARKLKRSGANLLGGRASVVRMNPLLSVELGEAFDAERAMLLGTLPKAVLGGDAKGFLLAYAALYLQEEIRAEALTRNVGAFSRFLEVAARQNGQVTNVSNIARDAGVGRTTVQNYFGILEDTLLGHWLQPWKLKPGNKQVAHPKFYLFDSGVARALSGRLPYAPTAEECGPLLETLVGNEIRAYLERYHPGWKINFWRTHDDVEVDFVVETDWGFVAVEVKAASEWRNRDGLGLRRLMGELTPREVRTFGVFRGPAAAKFGEIEVLPVAEFLSRLWTGRVMGDPSQRSAGATKRPRD